MADELADELCIRISEELRILPPISVDCSIFKVPAELRSVNEKAFEPVMLAIGPYHRGNHHLNAMEEHKMRYLKLLLQRRGEQNVTSYVNAMRALEERARKCYAEPVSLGKDEFVEMMLLDCCFITELLRKYVMKELRDINDPIFNLRWMAMKLTRDLLLVENQLPFFVLQEFFGMTLMPNELNYFHEMIFAFFRSVIPAGSDYSGYSIEEIKHLLGFIHDNLIPSPSPSAMRSCMNVTKRGNWEPIRCATELQDAGIRFKKVRGGSLFDIKFQNGILRIPRLYIQDDTESFLRNLIVYEQFSLVENLNYVTEYIFIMNCLIKSPKDVELLCRHGIIQNLLGDDEVVAKMFTRIGDFVWISSNYYYSAIFYNVNEFCGRRWNTWMAKLRKRYFNNPWALISFLAALLMLLLVVAQTLFSVLAYLK